MFICQLLYYIDVRCKSTEKQTIHHLNHNQYFDAFLENKADFLLNNGLNSFSFFLFINLKVNRYLNV